MKLHETFQYREHRHPRGWRYLIGYLPLGGWTHRFAIIANDSMGLSYIGMNAAVAAYKANILHFIDRIEIYNDDNGGVNVEFICPRYREFVEADEDIGVIDNGMNLQYKDGIGTSLYYVTFHRNSVVHRGGLPLGTIRRRLGGAPFNSQLEYLIREMNCELSV